jgi:iron complex outermembrane receptor protein
MVGTSPRSISQVFPGFKPVNAVDKGRNSAAVYADLEYDVTENG